MVRHKWRLQLKDFGIPIVENLKNTEGGKPTANLNFKTATKENYGIWADADNNNFHPLVKNAKDISPKPEDYVLIPFRFISSSLVGGETYKATKFPADTLKASMDKLLGVPIYTDHSTETVTNVIGYVESVTWSEGYTLDDGTVVPSGIEGNYAIDSKIAPNVARNLMSGAINSNSVTVEFYWKPSHSVTDGESFWQKIGTYDEKGNMYCRVVDEIESYIETSPVVRGADPFAKGIGKDGKIKRPDKGNIFYSFEKNEKDDENGEEIIWNNGNPKLHLVKQGLSYHQGAKASIITNTLTMNKNLLAFFAKYLKTPDLTDDALTDDAVDSFIQSYEAVQTDLASRPSLSEFSRLQGIEAATRTALGLTSDVAVTAESFKDVTVVATETFNAIKSKAEKTEGLETQVQSLSVERDALKADAAIGQSVVEEYRSEAIRLHTVLTSGAPVEATLSLIKGTNDVEALKGLITSFGGKVTKSEFKATCSKCKTGEHVTFQSSATGEDGTKGTLSATRKTQEEIDDERLKDVSL